MITRDLTTYIKEETKKGSTHEEITNHLLSKGWKQDDITTAFKTIASDSESIPNPPPPSPNTDQQYYVQAIPAEPQGKNPGRTEGIIAIIFALISLLFLPPIFGGAGIVMGALARKKGQKELGLIGIILSAVFLVIGMILGVALNVLVKNHAAAKGMIGSFLLP